MNSINFVCTSLVGTNKAGILKPDGNGYYRQRVGALNMFNSAGMFYPFEAARSIFMEGSSEFIRRVKRGALGGESGHPKFLPGMTEAAYYARLLSIWEDNICCHHSEIILDFDNAYDDAGNKIIGIDSIICPAGPHGDALRRSFENGKENVCFSVRSFTDDKLINGVVHRHIKKVVTFDKVVEPGIAIAEKFKTPGLEAREEGLVENRLVDVTGRKFSRGTVEEAMQQASMNPGLESVAMDMHALMASFGWNTAAVESLEKRATRAAWNSW